MKLNPHISVDCVVFGFDRSQLKVLLTKRKFQDAGGVNGYTDLKLPGDFITDEEDLDSAAHRILKELTGLENIYLRQSHVFGEPDRITHEHDLKWLRQTTGLPIERVVTISYYSLVKIDDSNQSKTLQHAVWMNVEEVNELAFDHLDIMMEALKTLRRKLQYEPIGMELLPEKFTIRQLQNLYEGILNKNLDNRNFRKKIFKADYLIGLDEKEKGVAHKPAQLYRFDKKIYSDKFNDFSGFQF